jgi:hypothetical protein
LKRFTQGGLFDRGHDFSAIHGPEGFVVELYDNGNFDKMIKLLKQKFGLQEKIEKHVETANIVDKILK